MTWGLLSFGIAVLMCGAVLMVWSFVGKRTELWTVGTPLALAGQAMILIGLVLQMDVVWQSSRHNLETLEGIDERISDLNRTTSLLTSTHGPTSRTFYHHMAEGASPQMLIADLKGQLDLLTARMANDRSGE